MPKDPFLTSGNQVWLTFYLCQNFVSITLLLYNMFSSPEIEYFLLSVHDEYQWLPYEWLTTFWWPCNPCYRCILKMWQSFMHDSIFIWFFCKILIALIPKLNWLYSVKIYNIFYIATRLSREEWDNASVLRYDLN